MPYTYDVRTEIFDFYSDFGDNKYAAQERFFDVDGDGKAEIITGADVGGGPRVRVLKVRQGFEPVADFFVYDVNLRSGVRVGTVDVNGDGKVELIVAPGVGGGPHIRILNPLNGQPTNIGDFFGADPASRSGFYVCGAPPRPN